MRSFLRPYPFWAQTLGTIVHSKDFRGPDTTGRIASGGWVGLDGSEKKQRVEGNGGECLRMLQPGASFVRKSADVFQVPGRRTHRRVTFYTEGSLRSDT